MYAAYALKHVRLTVRIRRRAALPEVNAEGVCIPPVLPCVVEVADAVMPLANDVVVRNLGSQVSTGRGRSKA